ncbi:MULTISPECIES: Rieske (2Fe-2S) protein [Streptomyces]|uniref:Rieske (2Fe-2S) protein n=1 Tax=Streptomyces TaxID=1883 RepID=UPI0033FF69C4
MIAVGRRFQPQNEEDRGRLLKREPGAMACGFIDGSEIEFVVVVTLAGEFLAFDSACPHLFANLYDDGRSTGKAIVCGSHGWEFSLETGAVISFPGKTLPKKKLDLIRIVEIDGKFEVEE